MTYQTNALYLIERAGPAVGTVHPLGGSVITLGRQAGSSIVINDHRVSRRHAQLVWRGTGYMLEDLGSGNGTWVNNARITTPVLLRSGDVIGLSQEVLLVYSDQPGANDLTYHVSAGVAVVPPASGGVVPAAPSSPGTAMAARPAALPAAPQTPSRGTGWLAFGVGGLIALVLALLLVIAGLIVYFVGRSPASVATSSPPAAVAVVATGVPPVTQTAVVAAATMTPSAPGATATLYSAPAASETPLPTNTTAPTLTPYPTYTPFPTATDTPVPTYTPVPTPTPYPTYTPYPTPAPTFTPYPTYTPYPTPMPTPTPYPTYTPYPTPLPTATPYPTYTPYPTLTSPPPPPPPKTRPTDTPVPPPPATPTPPPYVVTLGRNVSYEPWGNPADPKGCKGPYDDRIEVRRFTVQVILTNNSKDYVTFETPYFMAASGASLPRCYWAYNPDVPQLEVVPPGGTKDVTFGTHMQKGDWVKALVWEFPAGSVTICLNGSGTQVPCQ